MRKRSLKLDGYGISYDAYNELYYFCKQYGKKKQQVSAARNPYHSPQLTGLPLSGGIGNPTAAAVDRISELEKDIEMVEQSAIESAPGWYQELILAVTEDLQWKYLRLLRDFKPCEKVFNESRRKFFYLLAKKKKII